MFLIFKESINNIVKHSEAKKVKIELKVLEKYLTLELNDNGKGFDPEKSFENSLSSVQMGGNGVLSMEKRAVEMNGELEIISGIGTGTTIKLKLPIEQNVIV